jgi:hypothetical protein
LHIVLPLAPILEGTTLGKGPSQLLSLGLLRKQTGIRRLPPTNKGVATTGKNHPRIAFTRKLPFVTAHYRAVLNLSTLLMSEPLKLAPECLSSFPYPLPLIADGPLVGSFFIALFCLWLDRGTDLPFAWQ